MASRVNKSQFWFVSYLVLVMILHFNAILKSDDPVAEAQTDPILYDQKMEQDKDGVKAPATPKMIYYGGQGFLTKSSLSKYEAEIATVTAGSKKEKFNWSDWWEEKPTNEDSDNLESLPEDLPLANPDDVTSSEDSKPVREEKPIQAANAPAEEMTEDLPPQTEAETDQAESDWW